MINIPKNSSIPFSSKGPEWGKPDVNSPLVVIAFFHHFSIVAEELNQQLKSICRLAAPANLYFPEARFRHGTTEKENDPAIS